MSVDLNPIWLLAFLLAFTRSLAWLVVIPPFSNRRAVPTMVLIGIAAGLGILSEPIVARGAVPTGTAGLVGALVLQIVTGVALGFVVQTLLASVTAAGAMVDLFGGINLPPSLDPLSQDQTPLVGQFYEQVALALLFVSNAYLLLIRGFELSFSAPGLTLSSTGRASDIFLADLATFFVAALEIAAPIILVLFATQVGLAMLAKAAPQMNVWILGFPLQALMSLVFVAVGVRVLGPYVANLVSRSLQDMGALLGR